MEEKSWNFKSISAEFFAETMNSLWKSLSYLSSLSSHPLFSSIITLYTLILLYFPTLFLRIIFSPVLISTGILLLSLLRLGAIQRTEKELNSAESKQTHDSPDEDLNLESQIEMNLSFGFDPNPDPNPFYPDSFVEWNVRAPLEIIYEAYEGEEEEENDDGSREKREKLSLGIERYPSLSMYYPESDPDSSSDGDFPAIGNWDSLEGMSFRLEEEDRDGLIEISLDGKKMNKDFHFEEENLIEIDISPARKDEFSGEKW